MKRIVLLLTLITAVVSSISVQGEEQPRYLGPCSICQSSDGAFLFVVNMDGKSVSKVDLVGKSVAAEFPTPATPTGIAISTRASLTARATAFRLGSTVTPIRGPLPT